MATLVVSRLGLVGRRALLRLRAFLDGSSVHNSLYLLLALLGVRDASLFGFEILRASLACYRKAQELGLVVEHFGGQYYMLRVSLEVDMG